MGVGIIPRRWVLAEVYILNGSSWDRSYEVSKNDGPCFHWKQVTNNVKGAFKNKHKAGGQEDNAQITSKEICNYDGKRTKREVTTASFRGGSDFKKPGGRKNPGLRQLLCRGRPLRDNSR